MQRIALVMACLTCTGLGAHVQTPMDELQSSSSADRSTALATLLLALNPSTAFSGSAFGAHRSSGMPIATHALPVHTSRANQDAINMLKLTKYQKVALRNKKYNRKYIGQMRSKSRRMREVVEEGNYTKAALVLRTAMRVIDKTSRRGVIKPNQASRRKSRLHLLVRRLENVTEGGKRLAPKEVIRDGEWMEMPSDQPLAYGETKYIYVEETIEEKQARAAAERAAREAAALGIDVADLMEDDKLDEEDEDDAEEEDDEQDDDDAEVVDAEPVDEKPEEE